MVEETVVIVVIVAVEEAVVAASEEARPSVEDEAVGLSWMLLWTWEIFLRSASHDFIGIKSSKSLTLC